MTKPINLNQERKDRARQNKRKQSNENARRFGRSKVEKAQDNQVAEQNQSTVDQHRLDE